MALKTTNKNRKKQIQPQPIVNEQKDNKPIVNCKHIYYFSLAILILIIFLAV